MTRSRNTLEVIETKELIIKSLSKHDAIIYLCKHCRWIKCCLFPSADGCIPVVSKLYILSTFDWKKVSCLLLTPRDAFQNISKHPFISDQSLKS